MANDGPCNNIDNVHSIKREPSAIHRRLPRHLCSKFHTLPGKVGTRCFNGNSPATPTLIRRVDITTKRTTRGSCRPVPLQALQQRLIPVLLLRPRLRLAVAANSRPPVLFLAHLLDYVLVDFFLTGAFHVASHSTAATKVGIECFLVHLPHDKCVDFILRERTLRKRTGSGLSSRRSTTPARRTHGIDFALMVRAHWWWWRLNGQHGRFRRRIQLLPINVLSHQPSNTLRAISNRLLLRACQTGHFLK